MQDDGEFRPLATGGEPPLRWPYRRYAVALLVGGLVYLFFHLNIPETYAALWHLRHGGHATFQSTSFPISPLKFAHSTPRSLMVFSTSGIVRGRLGQPSFTIHITSAQRDINQARTNVNENERRSGSVALETRAADFTGGLVNCDEYMVKGGQEIRIWCFGESKKLAITFEGDASGIPEFYEFLKGAKSFEQ